ncbi:hypothetical protein [Staphylococcus succinus]|uniref:hypothetical protein n=1 Tax=Staphylococcus succinus TaxID=61015 RepID=UPI003F573684
MSGLNNFKADVSSADYVIEKFYKNPGKFASVVLRMYWDMKAERDTLIDDLKVLREKNEKLKNRAENAMKLAERSNCEVLKLERENEKLVEEKDDILLEREYYNNGYKDMTRRGKELESKYTTLTDHIRLKAKNNPGVSRYIALVNFIDRLEKGEK